MRSRLTTLTLFVLLGAAASSDAQARQAAPAAAATTDVAVTISYTGKGPVDSSHSILLFLFTDPNIGPQSEPIGAPQIAVKNGATVRFKNVTAKAVYVVAIYNEKGTYDGASGPPPPGTPIGIYAKDAKSPPLAVTPGARTAIKMTFNDAKRWGQAP